MVASLDVASLETDTPLDTSKFDRGRALAAAEAGGAGGFPSEDLLIEG